jgi:hypothetical protein
MWGRFIHRQSQEPLHRQAIVDLLLCCPFRYVVQLGDQEHLQHHGGVVGTSAIRNATGVDLHQLICEAPPGHSLLKLAEKMILRRDPIIDRLAEE